MADFTYIMDNHCEKDQIAILLALGYSRLLRTIDLDLLQLKLEFVQAVRWKTDTSTTEIQPTILNYRTEAAVGMN